MVALARERHFVRAAQSCSAFQPALSEGTRKLEKELNVPLIRRGNKFEDLTAEGQEVAIWTRKILADRDAMNDEIDAMRAGANGQHRFGSVPTASIAVSLLNAPFCALHPLARVQMVSDLTYDDVLSRLRLRSYEIDAGVTYIRDPVPAEFRVLPLYREQYVVLTGAGAGTASSATWAQTAAMPLCLLASTMQGRRRIDDVFAEVGVKPEPRLETDSVPSLFAHVKTGSWATIVPSAWLHVFGVPANLHAVPLIGPDRFVPVGLVTLARDPAPILERVLASVAESTDLTFLENLPAEQRW